ncbi:anhydro-N-acetylmuramic acid kinase [Rhizobium sp. Root708]|uniref:anhydro-N-acetylmuramic acid kinase n=1 Tax=Rhizobium sp. Root708 TaxID=1736592 RepID=UPI0006FBA4A6|nr:anhydro-N-acetylmuramic acid kinase [Rhizobium sp. Root708]KRB60155.1 anhydro-N-acetylmuramic acid kinase [Rhizobium sp. Root708]
MGKIRTAIGLMSGTSMDGIDVALLHTDGRDLVERGPSVGVAYDPAFRDRLKLALEQAKSITQREQRPGDLVSIERELTLRHAAAVKEFLIANALDASSIDVIGFHGQTVLHRPDEALTVQIGDGARLARETGIPVAYDLRANDMVHGGQGAPLVPVYHAALAANVADATLPVCFVNIGGISNLTYIGADGVIVGYDSGPGNTLIDQWVETHAGVPFDQGGMIASEGRVIGDLADRYLSSPFFTAEKRRSLDRNDFPPPSGGDAELADGARTLAYVAAASIFKSAGHLPMTPTLYVICGGGRLNRVLMQDLKHLAQSTGAKVIAAEEAGFNGDSMEAEAWAYLAVRSLDDLPLTFPGTTGVRVPVSGGVLVKP